MSGDPDARLCAEDLPIGIPIVLGSHSVTADEIVRFATLWDPQPMHVDPDAAVRNSFGGLIASGLHTLGIFQRLAVDGAYRHWRIIVGRTLREIRFPAPLRPGTTVDGSLVVEAVRHRRPDRSLVTLRGRLTADGRLVLEMVCDAYVARRA